MLPSKLAALKQQLEHAAVLSDDDRRALLLLRIMEKQTSSGDTLTKSFSVAPGICPTCGSRMQNL